jgi:hypothetical protein
MLFNLQVSYHQIGKSILTNSCHFANVFLYHDNLMWIRRGWSQIQSIQWVRRMEERNRNSDTLWSQHARYLDDSTRYGHHSNLSFDFFAPNCLQLSMMTPPTDRSHLNGSEYDWSPTKWIFRSSSLCTKQFLTAGEMRIISPKEKQWKGKRKLSDEHVKSKTFCFPIILCLNNKD